MVKRALVENADNDLSGIRREFRWYIVLCIDIVVLKCSMEFQTKYAPSSRGGESDLTLTHFPTAQRPRKDEYSSNRVYDLQ